MHLSYRCPHCEQLNRTELDREHARLACTECGWERNVPQRVLQENRPCQCLVCGNLDLWRQKDFPQSWGVACVALGALLSSIAWYYHRPLTALAILMGFALWDMILYVAMPDVLVCYRCGGRHSRADTSQHHEFDHELGERYRQEAIRAKHAP